MGPSVRVGTAGWSYPDWNGRVYPRPRPRGFDPLSFLAGYVDLVELNASFYAPPRQDHAQRWMARVAERPRFRFTAKLHRSFTHESLPPDAELERRIATFLEGLEPLTQRLSALLVQFPHSFRRTVATRKHLGRLIDHLQDQAPPLVLEFRHASWFSSEALARLRDRALSVAAIDLPRAHDHPPASFTPTGPVGYLRLHGRNRATWFDAAAGRDERYDYLYDERELEELAGRARRIAGESDETLVVTNNHFGGQALANALELTARLSKARVDVPVDLALAFPRLAAIARQPPLFE